MPKDFDNVVRLFPLPNVVLFPGVVQALHIFEPRYRQLISDALASDELVTMAMLDMEQATPDDPRPNLLSTVCIGKIVSHNQLEDGRFNLLVVGSARAQITNEMVTDHPYRMAEVKLLADSHIYAPDDVEQLNQQVLELFRVLVDRRGAADVQSLSRLFEGDLPLGQICDLICYACGAEPMQQQQVLQEPEVCRRAEILIGILQGLISGPLPNADSDDDFPPQFSDN